MPTVNVSALLPPYLLPYDTRTLAESRLNSSRDSFGAVLAPNVTAVDVRDVKIDVAEPSLYARQCLFDEDCDYIDTACNVQVRRCNCPDGYYSERSFISSLPSDIIESSLYCLRAAFLNDKCIKSVQCLPPGSRCGHGGACECRPGFAVAGECATLSIQ